MMWQLKASFLWSYKLLLGWGCLLAFAYLIVVGVANINKLFYPCILSLRGHFLYSEFWSMGRQPCCDKIGLKRGPWTVEEDHKLMNFILNNGIHCWRTVPKLAGLLRCGKSCRLRWINYLRPDLKRGGFTEADEDQIIRLHSNLGNKWSKIAAHFPGRTDNEIKNHWNTRIKKRLKTLGLDPLTHKPLADDDQKNQSSSSSSNNNHPTGRKTSPESSNNDRHAANNQQQQQQQQQPNKIVVQEEISTEQFCADQKVVQNNDYRVSSMDDYLSSVNDEFISAERLKLVENWLNQDISNYYCRSDHHPRQWSSLFPLEDSLTALMADDNLLLQKPEMTTTIMQKEDYLDQWINAGFGSLFAAWDGNIHHHSS